MSAIHEWRNVKFFQELPDPDNTLSFHDSSFTRFPDFPIELRKMIWEAAIELVPQQFIYVNDFLYRPVCERQPSFIWDLFQVNRESRKIIRAEYIFVGPGRYAEPTINRDGWYLNKSRDILCIYDCLLERTGNSIFIEEDRIQSYNEKYVEYSTTYSSHYFKWKQYYFDCVKAMKRVEIRRPNIDHDTQANIDSARDVVDEHLKFPQYLANFPSMKEVKVVPHRWSSRSKKEMEICETILATLLEDFQATDKTYRIPNITFKQDSPEQMALEELEGDWQDNLFMGLPEDYEEFLLDSSPEADEEFNYMVGLYASDLALEE
jgi:hypothetical protein